jgi:hypothetical protein
MGYYIEPQQNVNRAFPRNRNFMQHRPCPQHRPFPRPATPKPAPVGDQAFADFDFWSVLGNGLTGAIRLLNTPLGREVVRISLESWVKSRQQQQREQRLRVSNR